MALESLYDGGLDARDRALRQQVVTACPCCTTNAEHNLAAYMIQEDRDFQSLGFDKVVEYEWKPADDRPDMGVGDLVLARGDGSCALVLELKMLHSGDSKVAKKARRHQAKFAKFQALEYREKYVMRYRDRCPGLVAYAAYASYRPRHDVRPTFGFVTECLEEQQRLQALFPGHLVELWRRSDNLRQAMPIIVGPVIQVPRPVIQPAQATPATPPPASGPQSSFQVPRPVIQPAQATPPSASGPQSSFQEPRPVIQRALAAGPATPPPASGLRGSFQGPVPNGWAPRGLPGPATTAAAAPDPRACLPMPIIRGPAAAPAPATPGASTLGKRRAPSEPDDEASPEGPVAGPMPPLDDEAGLAAGPAAGPAGGPVAVIEAGAEGGLAAGPPASSASLDAVGPAKRSASSGAVAVAALLHGCPPASVKLAALLRRRR